MNKIKLAFILFAALLGFSTQANAQSKHDVRVTVSDDQGLVVGAAVMLKGTSHGSITDFDGVATLLDVPENSTIVVSFLGFKDYEIKITDQTSVSVLLEQDSNALEESVVVGYGVQKKKLVTGSTVQVKGDLVAKMNTTSALGALQSQTPGVSITANNGMPGEGFKVTIRGLGTVGDSAPLYIIDGIAGGDINSLNPSDIESVDVLKDAASAAIYGSRAGNGVILVTTKQGKDGKMTVDYDAYVGWQNIYKMPSMLTAQQSMILIDEMNFMNGTPALDWKTQLGDYTWNKIQSGWTGTNWLDEMRNRNAFMQNHAVNITGGSQTSKFSAGFSYTSQDGIIGKPVAPNYERYTARLNSDHVLLKNNDREIIKFGENLTFFYYTQNSIAQLTDDYNDVQKALTTTPLLPAYNADGEYFSLADKYSTGWIYNDVTGNPLIELVYNHSLNLTRSYGLNASAFIEIMPVKGLKFRSLFSYNMKAYSNRGLTVPYEASTTFASSAYTVSQSTSMGHSISLENTLSYTLPNLKGHSLDFLLGQSIEKTGTGENLSVTNSAADGTQLPSMLPDMDHAWISNVANALNGTTISGSPYSEWALASFFGRVNYSYNDKYLATIILRADGSSNFARGHRWGAFPSVSAGWIITEEPWIKTSRNGLSFFKIRASWGLNGNQSISNFQYISPIAFDSSHSYVFGDTMISSSGTKSIGAYAKTLANENVSWEKSEQYDLGFDAVMLRSRLRLSADGYIKTTKDWLVVAPILATAGTSAPYINGGNVSNKGVEISLSWNDELKCGLVYGASINAAYNKNEVTQIANSEQIIHGDSNYTQTEFYRAQVGYPIGYFWGYKTAGVFQTHDEIEQWIADGNGVAQENPQPGDLKYVDLDKNGIIDDNDKTMIGDPHPDWTLGISANVAFKGFDLSITTSSAFGHQIYFGYRSNTTEAFNRWHGEGTSNRYPSLRTGSTTSTGMCDLNFENADYLKIQNITLGYDIKSSWKSCPLSQMRIYASLQNPFTFTKYPGLDPEVGFGGSDLYGNTHSWVTGVDKGSYPAARSIILGVNLKF